MEFYSSAWKHLKKIIYNICKTFCSKSFKTNKLLCQTSSQVIVPKGGMRYSFSMEVGKDGTRSVSIICVFFLLPPPPAVILSTFAEDPEAKSPVELLN